MKSTDENFWDRKSAKFSSKIFIEISVEIFWSGNFRNFSISKFSIFIQFPMKIFVKKTRFFNLKKIVGRFQNSLIMVLINRFGQNFVQNYVEFNGGGRGIKIQANGVCGRPLQKKLWLCKKKWTSWRSYRHRAQHTPSLPDDTFWKLFI